jgi:hypothetical protein
MMTSALSTRCPDGDASTTGCARGPPVIVLSVLLVLAVLEVLCVVPSLALLLL